VRGVWAAAHIAVLPSLGGEGLPKTLLEAAAMGRPLIATDVPGNRRIVQPGVNGMLVPPGDPEALAEALASLAGDAAQRSRFGAASRRLVEDGLSDAAVTSATVTLYRALLDELGPGKAESMRPSMR
jgi:glycosyltransferase involved in cell wall biosynthesis